MTTDPATDLVRLFVALLGAAILLALAARRLDLPHTVVLVLFGIAIGAFDQGRTLEVSPQLVLSVFLPGLVFEAALRIGVDDLRRSFIGISVLAIPGVVIAAALVGAFLGWAIGLPPALGFVVGAMVSPTDPAAVIATFKRLRTPRELATFVEAESLFNDGTGIVLFTIAVAAVRSPVDPLSGVLLFVLVVAISAVIGAIGGLAGSKLITYTDDHLVELSTTIVVAYGTYLVADWLHLSGVVGTVVAGVVLSTYGRTHGMTARTIELLDEVWELIGFLLTAFLFLLVGLVISPDQLLGQLPPIAWAVAAILLARAVAVYVLVGPLSRVGRRIRLVPRMPLAWLHVTFWSGLRGAVAVALALSLPADMPQRALLQEIAFGVVLVTLLVQGTTAKLVVTRLGLSQPRP
jgi:monovalent cation:H+ antiporter, CPA1 family